MHLLISLLLSQFPSGSAISYRDGKLFLVGDDSSTILILTTDYQELGSIQLSHHPQKRIPKKEKPDYEASTFVSIDGKEQLMILGSGSKENRKIVRLFPFVNDTIDLAQSKIINTDAFIKRVQQAGITEINFEGLTVFNDNLIVSNRGNLSNNTNHLIITNTTFWENTLTNKMQVISLQLPKTSGTVPGVSELCYEKSLDLLLITLSSEETDNAYDDGAIGNSYLGWISNFSTKTNNQLLAMDKMICLPEIDKEFKKEKIEGICVEKIQNSSMILHLIADNDAGESKLFKVELPASYYAKK